MKKVITAIGSEEINNILKKQDDIIIENPDIQYQEGIIEALERYSDIDILILKDGIIGYLELNELIREVIIRKQDIEIILLREEDNDFTEYENIVKIVNNKKYYVKAIFDYFIEKGYITNKKVTGVDNKQMVKYNILSDQKVLYKTSDILNTNTNTKTKRYKEKKKVSNNQKSVIVVISKSGVREDNFYICIIQIDS